MLREDPDAKTPRGKIKKNPTGGQVVIEHDKSDKKRRKQNLPAEFRPTQLGTNGDFRDVTAMADKEYYHQVFISPGVNI